VTLRLKAKLEPTAPLKHLGERLEEIVRKTAGRQQDRKLRLFIWEMLADYANGNTEIFEQLVWGSIRIHNYMMNPDGYVDFRELREGLTFKDAAVKYQPDFRQVVLWLVHQNGKAGNAALPFLWRHAHAIKTRPHPSPRSLEYGLSLVDKGSVASPVCEFILSGIDRHNRGDEDIPLGVCENCKQFMAIDRKGRKKFCSKNCGVKNFYGSRGGAAKYMSELRQNPMYKKRQT
jgi:hypothetical protein